MTVLGFGIFSLGRPYWDLVSFREADTYLPVRPFQSSKSLKNTGEDDRNLINRNLINRNLINRN